MPKARTGVFRGIKASGTSTSERVGCTLPVLALMLVVFGVIATWAL